jgi:hypothetical protein
MTLDCFACLGVQCMRMARCNVQHDPECAVMQLLKCAAGRRLHSAYWQGQGAAGRQGCDAGSVQQFGRLLPGGSCKAEERWHQCGGHQAANDQGERSLYRRIDPDRVQDCFAVKGKTILDFIGKRVGAQHMVTSFCALLVLQH